MELARGAAPVDWPEGTFDLILLSEVVYYRDPADVERMAERVGGSLTPGGDLVLAPALWGNEFVCLDTLPRALDNVRQTA